MGGRCVEKCEGCDHKKDDLCQVFYSPEAKFRVGRGVSCGMATHLMTRAVENEKVRVGQQKTKRIAVKV